MFQNFSETDFSTNKKQNFHINNIFESTKNFQEQFFGVVSKILQKLNQKKRAKRNKKKIISMHEILMRKSAMNYKNYLSITISLLII